MAAVSPARLETGKTRVETEACFRPASGRAAVLRAVMLTAVAPEALADLTGNRGGTPAITQASSVAASGATPGAILGECENAVGSPAGRLSMTVRRVSIVVP